MAESPVGTQVSGWRYGAKRILGSFASVCQRLNQLLLKVVAKVFPWNRRARRRLNGGSEDEWCYITVTKSCKSDFIKKLFGAKQNSKTWCVFVSLFEHENGFEQYPHFSKFGHCVINKSLLELWKILPNKLSIIREKLPSVQLLIYILSSSLKRHMSFLALWTRNPTCISDYTSSQNNFRWYTVYHSN